MFSVNDFYSPTRQTSWTPNIKNDIQGVTGGTNMQTQNTRDVDTQTWTHRPNVRLATILIQELGYFDNLCPCHFTVNCPKNRQTGRPFLSNRGESKFSVQSYLRRVSTSLLRPSVVVFRCCLLRVKRNRMSHVQEVRTCNYSDCMCQVEQGPDDLTVSQTFVCCFIRTNSFCSYFERQIFSVPLDRPISYGLGFDLCI